MAPKIMVSSPEYVLESYGFFLKAFHAFAGLYIWEYITSLHFEWEVYTGKRPWRWSFIWYIAARVLTLGAFIGALVGFNLTTEFHCNVWFRSCLAMGWLAAATSSFLLVLRGVAIWGRDPRIVVITGTFWLANLAGSFYAITRAHTQWTPILKTCAITDTVEFRWSLTINFIEGVALLGIMVWGVLQKRSATQLWNVLYFQGVFWVLIAIMAKLPTIAMCFKNINDPWNLMFQFPHLTLMVIASTRAYRDLVQCVHTNDQDSNPSRRRREVTWMRSASRNERDVEITVNKTVAFDVELRLGKGAPATPSRMGDKESGSDTPEHKKEEQYIGNSGLQVKRGLESQISEATLAV
ncbi:hypothetical protein BJV78DRAFT_1233019 [Lactifluus subvellereus]|nr:hypothetical protein BJV78DRAFT_1233019 [Lactifluus subvellereus]